jgi:hypothetical protein
MVVEKPGRFMDDASSLSALISLLPRPERQTYLSYGALSKEAAFPNRKLVVYTLRAGRPDNVSLLTTGDMTLSRISGPVVDVSDEAGTVEVGVMPVRWRGRDLFLQVPQHFELKWTGKDVGLAGVQFVPQYALLTKTRSKEIHQVEGHTYCVTMNKFRERFPDIPIRY